MDVNESCDAVILDFLSFFINLRGQVGGYLAQGKYCNSKEIQKIDNYGRHCGLSFKNSIDSLLRHFIQHLGHSKELFNASVGAQDFSLRGMHRNNQALKDAIIIQMEQDRYLTLVMWPALSS
jgi:hypothetical protein